MLTAAQADRLCMYACMGLYLATQVARLACAYAASTLSKPNPAWLNRLTRR